MLEIYELDESRRLKLRSEVVLYEEDGKTPYFSTKMVPNYFQLGSLISNGKVVVWAVRKSCMVFDVRTGRRLATNKYFNQ